MDKLDKRIEENFKKLDDFEKGLGLSPKLQKLMNKVFFVQERIEGIIDAEFINYIKEPIRFLEVGHFFELITLLVRIYPLFNSLSYNEKLEVLEKFEHKHKISLSEFQKVNRYRIWFAHPHDYKEDLEKLEKNKQQYNEALELFINVIKKYDIGTTYGFDKIKPRKMTKENRKELRKWFKENKAKFIVKDKKGNIVDQIG